MKKFLSLILSALLLVTCSLSALAGASDTTGFSYKNEETGYEAVLCDGAGYLSADEQHEVLNAMKDLTAYCNILYVTDPDNTSKSMSYSKQLALDVLDRFISTGTTNSVVYVCDNAYDYIYADGDAYDVITTAKANSITDNIYEMSADKDFAGAALECFKEIGYVYEGRRISEPMKYICNLFIALFIAFLASYLVVSSRSKLKRPTNNDLVAGAVHNVSSTPIQPELVNTTRVYSPPSSSGGGGGGHGGGGHGGGGGHSGGGGGHAH